jgi:two-component system OmpR family response regulator
MRVLVIEDDEKIASYLKKGLSQVGFAVDTVTDAAAGRDMIETQSFAVLLVDLMLPGGSGEAFIRELREQGDTTPVLILSAKQSVDDRVGGLRSGADDYITKPFSFSELVERVRALMRRTEYDQGQTATLTAGDLTLDLSRREAYRGGEQIDLKPRELSLLELLLRNRGNVVPKAVILERVWNLDFDPQTNVVDVLVHRLRKKIDDPFPRALIETVRGIGYRLNDG